MNRLWVAALIGVATSVLMAALVVPIMLVFFFNGPGTQDIAYWISILTPNLVLILVPGALAAVGYLVIESRTRRR